jgi:hypothetical protein
LHQSVLKANRTCPSFTSQAVAQFVSECMKSERSEAKVTSSSCLLLALTSFS